MGRSRKIKKVVKSGLPTGRIGDELNSGVDERHNYRHHMKGPFRFEWWFFNVWFENGYGATITFEDNWYAKPWKKECEIQFHIYLPDGGVIPHFFRAPKDMFEASNYCTYVRLMDNWIRGDMRRLEVHADIEGDGLDLVFEGRVPPWMPGTGENYFPMPLYQTCGWFLPQPVSDVSGTLTVKGETMPVKGIGEVERNWGDTLLALTIDNWHWQYFIIGDIGIVCWEMMMNRKLDYDCLYVLLVCKGDRLVYESQDFSITYEDWIDEGSFVYPEKINVAFEGDGGKIKGEFSLRVKEIASKQDLLEIAEVPKLIRKLVVKSGLAKLIYTRFISEIEGYVEIEGERSPLQGDIENEQMLMRGKYPAICYQQQSSG